MDINSKKPKPTYFSNGAVPFKCPFSIKFSESTYHKWENQLEQYWFIHMIDEFYQTAENLWEYIETSQYSCLNITHNIHETNDGKGMHFNGTFSRRNTFGEFENSPEFHFYTNSTNTSITNVSFCTTFKRGLK